MDGESFGGGYAGDAPSTNYGLEKAVQQGQTTLRKKLELEVADWQRRIDINKEMMKLLDDNPAIERFMDLSRGYLRK